MPKRTGAVAVAKAGAKVQRAERKVATAEKALEKARKAKDQADYEYLELLKETLPTHLQRVVTQSKEVAEEQTA